MDRTEILMELRHRGWKFIEQFDSPFRLPADLADRYPRIPDSLNGFLSGLAECTNAEQTIWFLCEPNYQGTADSAFQWNEFEKMSLEAADGDEELEAQVRSFWDTHFPFMISLHDGYLFYAVCTSPDRFGQIVEGREPEFEEATVVSESFPAFLEKLLQALPR